MFYVTWSNTLSNYSLLILSLFRVYFQHNQSGPVVILTQKMKTIICIFFSAIMLLLFLKPGFPLTGYAVVLNAIAVDGTWLN